MSCKIYSILFLVCLFAVGSIAPGVAENKEVSTLVDNFCDDDEIVSQIVAYSKKIGKGVSETGIVKFLEDHVLWHEGLTVQQRGNLLFHMALHALKPQLDKFLQAYPGSSKLPSMFPGMASMAETAGINGEIVISHGMKNVSDEEKQIKKFGEDMVVKMQEIIKSSAGVSHQSKSDDVWAKMIARVKVVAQETKKAYDNGKKAGNSWTGWFTSLFH
ncbi:hypothetical protein DdX_11730 [Ditylenchus destructor]|uniref:Uncharacterized protein n=1 Tax=Ditylenchus destructor TaxID=166010 RepID=A0AAD4MXM4_9BILA|nr:hypothetical protein DdX_11730 [Ditylenchus destructor]